MAALTLSASCGNEGRRCVIVSIRASVAGSLLRGSSTKSSESSNASNEVLRLSMASSNCTRTCCSSRRICATTIARRVISTAVSRPAVVSAPPSLSAAAARVSFCSLSASSSNAWSLSLASANGLSPNSFLRLTSATSCLLICSPRSFNASSRGSGLEASVLSNLANALSKAPSSSWSLLLGEVAPDRCVELAGHRIAFRSTGRLCRKAGGLWGGR